VTADVHAWLAAHGQSTAGSVRRIEAATTADLYAIGDLVLRWYARGTFLVEEPDALRREAAALTALADTLVPAPRLVAWSQDPPALLMTRVPGEHALDAGEPRAVLDVLDAVHAVETSGLGPWTYRGYHEGRDLPAPRWWRDRATWDRAVRLSADRPLAVEPVFIHRDFHPGNILWTGPRIGGVVDWGNACVGPAAFDLAHYRVNIASLVGCEAADQAFPGDPAWDIEAALGYMDPWSPDARDDWVGPWPHVPASVARDRVQRFLGRAVAALG
jgi:aminoglycoside phosphotransferase (APT) family kinase protein